jgi:hypothetical protein
MMRIDEKLRPERFWGIVFGMRFKHYAPLLCVFVVLLVLASTPRVSDAWQQKLKPEELIAKHLESIGSIEKLKSAKSRATIGSTQVSFRVGGSGTMNGKANILSQGSSVRAGFTYSALEYPGEQIAFDGTKVTAGQMSPGNYPPFSRFIYENDVLLKEGLLFGSLSTAWALLDVGPKRPRLDSTGIKKIDGKQLYELKYQPRSSRVNVQGWLYFEPETFRHVRSQFKLEAPVSTLRSITDSAETVRYQIIERFDDFKETDGLTLPHSYNLEFTVDSPRGGLLTTWTHAIERIVQNEPIERPLFSLQ